MVNVYRFLLLFFVGFLAACSGDSIINIDQRGYRDMDSIGLIPYPQHVEKGDGYFIFNEKTNFMIPSNLHDEGRYLILNTVMPCVWNLKLNQPNAKDPSIIIELDKTIEQINSSPETYSLEITKDKITLRAAEKVGIIRGINTLRQIIYQSTRSTYVNRSKISHKYIPCGKITDYPKFEHRGLMLDVCRHFFETHVIRKYIDELAYYKMNVLHLHLTDDQGWRMPIDKYPLLNEISSWRLDSNGNKYGGFYTKDELKELVAYAEEQYITIIPEIELPGHAQAALAAYPQFSCTGGPIEVVNDWGVFKEIYCAGNDSTFMFIEDILTEVMEIFPSKYIHIGGDEAPKFRWEHCPNCQKRMKDEGLTNEHELQSYFIKRIEKFLAEHGRVLIGWDEILEGGLSENAAVQSWRGFEGGMEAARAQHNVVMSPTSHCYLDYGLSSIDLRKIYSFDPIPEDLEEKYHPYIIGGECNMWTEHVPDKANLDSKVFPRMLGLAEVLWTYNKERDFEDFYRRLQTHYPHLEGWNINYGLETIGAKLKEEINDSGIFIMLEKNLSDLDLKYRWNQNEDYVAYTVPIKLEKSGELDVQAYKKGEPYGDPIHQNYVTHQALNKKVTYFTSYNQWYVGNGDLNLVDGKTGSIDFHDGAWQGFWGEDIEVVIDLGAIQTIHSVKTNFYQYSNSWIFLPQKVEVLISEDGEIWRILSTEITPKIDLTNIKKIKSFELNPSVGRMGFPKARYIKFVANSIGKVPAGHEAEGQDSWLFIDEISVN